MAFPIPPPERQCVALRKKDGERCEAFAVKGKTKCAGHLHLGIAGVEALRVRGREASAHSRAETKAARKRSPRDWLALKLEAHSEMLIDGALKAADEGDWRAGAWLFERVLGKPQELVKIDSAAQDIQQMTPEQRAELRRRALELHPELAELVPRSEVTREEPDERQDAGDPGARPAA